MSEKIPVQVVEETEAVLETESNPDSNIDKSVDRSEDVEISAGEKENVKTAQIDDLSPEVVEKANAYITIVSENKESQVDLKSQLNKMEWNDPQKPLVERELRQTEKEQSRFNHELLNADNNLLRTERQLYDKFIEESESKEEQLDPEEVIAKYDDKFASLTASVAELDKYIEERRMSYHLNTKRAYEDVVLGPKMRERDAIKEELNQVQESWLQLGGGAVDKAREMVAVKRAYDLLNEQASQEGVGNGRSEAEGTDNQEANEIPGLEEETSGAESGAETIDTSEMFSGYEKRLRAVEYEGNADFYRLFGEIEKDVMGNQALSGDQKKQLLGDLTILLGNISGNKSEGQAEEAGGTPEPKTEQSDSDQFQSIDKTYDAWKGAMTSWEDADNVRQNLQRAIMTYFSGLPEEKQHLMDRLSADFPYDPNPPAEQAARKAAEEKDHHKAEKKQQKEKSGFFKGLFRRDSSAKRDKLSLGTGGDGSADKKRNNALLGLSLLYFWGKN